MSDISLEELHATLPQLIGEKARNTEERCPGMMKGTVLYLSDDFNEPLDVFKEYASCPTC